MASHEALQTLGGCSPDKSLQPPKPLRQCVTNQLEIHAQLHHTEKMQDQPSYTPLKLKCRMSC